MQANLQQMWKRMTFQVKMEDAKGLATVHASKFFDCDEIFCDLARLVALIDTRLMALETLDAELALSASGNANLSSIEN